MHELLSVHSEEELDCIRHAGVLCTRAMEAIADRARPGVTEYQLRAAAGAAILEGNGDIDFLIIGSTPMADPAMVFGNPRPSWRELQEGDRSEEHTSELQSLMRNSYAVFCLKKKNK